MIKILDDNYELPIRKIGKNEILFIPTHTVNWKFDSFAKLYGAKDNNRVFGRAGRTYSVPVAMKPNKWLPYFNIKYFIGKFNFYCRKHSDKKFLIPYFTAPVYTDEILGRLFRPFKDLDNVYLCKEFYPFAITDEDLILTTDCGHEFAI